jgi:hypothetical protein
LWLERDVSALRQQDEINRDITLAWRITQMFGAAWVGKLPPLRDLLIGEPRKRMRMQTGQEAASTIHAMAARYGLQVTREPRPKHG